MYAKGATVFSFADFKKTLLITISLLVSQGFAEEGVITSQILDLQRTAEKSVEAKNYAQAREKYQAVIQAFSETEHAMKAQIGILETYLLEHNITAAKQGVDSLPASYKQYPGYAEQMHTLACHFRDRRELAQAISMYDSLLTEFPTHERAAWILNSKAYAYLKAGDIAKAQQCAGSLLAGYTSCPDYIQWVHSLGNHFRKYRRFDDAIMIYDSLLTRYPTDERAAWILSSKGYAYLEAGDTTGAVQCAASLLSGYTSCPDYVQRVHDLGNQFQGHNQPEQAITIFESLLTRYPTHERAASILCDKAQAYFDLGDVVNAKQCAASLLSGYANCPDYVRRVHNLGKEFQNRNLSDQAIAIYESLLSRFSADERATWVQCDKAYAYFITGDMVKVEDSIQVLFEKYKSCPDFIKRSEILARQIARCQPSKAREIYNRLLQVLSGSEKSTYLIQPSIVRIYLEVGDQENADEAMDVFMTKYSDEEDFVRTAQGLANSFCRKNDVSKALEIYSHLLRAYPDHEQAIYIKSSMARIYVTMGVVEQAETMIQTIFEKNQKHSEFAKVMNQIASSYFQNKNYTRAIELYQAALANARDKAEQVCAYGGMAKSQIHLHDSPAASYPAVEATVERLIAEFSGYEKTGVNIFMIGEEYYFKAEKAASQNEELARDCYLKSIAVWEKIATQIADSRHRCMAYYYSAIACQNTGQMDKAMDYFEKVIAGWPEYDRRWHALAILSIIYKEQQRENKISNEASIAKIRPLYQEIAEKYPESPSAPMAQNWLRNH